MLCTRYPLEGRACPVLATCSPRQESPLPCQGTHWAGTAGYRRYYHVASWFLPRITAATAVHSEPLPSCVR